MAAGGEPIPRDEAFRIVDRVAATIPLEQETLDVVAAHGRVLSEDQCSALDLPPFDKSAMDGYAVMAQDVREEYRLIETVPAGKVPTLPLRPGFASKVMTGAPVPRGTGRVIRVEDTEYSPPQVGDHSGTWTTQSTTTTTTNLGGHEVAGICTEEQGGAVRILRREDALNLARQAEDVRRGDLILRRGTPLGSREIANLIGCGISRAAVARRVKVAILSTGDELVDRPQALTAGKIMDTNGPMLALLAQEHGLEVVARCAVPDDLAATRAALGDALELADCVLLSGGVSVGDFDFVLRAFPEVGLEVHFSRLRVQPGRPTVFAAGANRLVFGLPGNPVAVFLMFHLLVRRAVARMAGAEPPLREFVLPLSGEYRRRSGERLGYVPCRITPRGTLDPVSFHGSAHLMALAETDGFFLVPAGVTALAAGEGVAFALLPGR